MMAVSDDRRSGGTKPSQVTDASGAGLHMQHQRVNRGLLAQPEHHALHWLAERTPAWIKPDHLTAVGVAGAALVMVGFVCANLSPWFVGLVIFGLLLNWYGDSLDGTLARFRRIERPHFGYFIDHACDLVSQTLIFFGLGLSPYFTLRSALFALSMYLLISSYTYLKVMILRTHQLSYGGMGATELRVALACWSLIAIWIGLDPARPGTLSYPALDQVIGAMWVLVFLGFIWMVRSDLARLRPHFEQHDPAPGTAIDGARVTGPDRRPTGSASSR